MYKYTRRFSNNSCLMWFFRTETYALSTSLKNTESANMPIFKVLKMQNTSRFSVSAGGRIRVLYVQVVVHDGDVQADVVHAVRGDVEDDGLVVGGVQSVLLDARLLLFQTSAVTYERHFDVGI